MIKATYGTGSSVMMNIGTKPIISDTGVVTSLAWGMDGKVEYVLEGNINYTGSVITWMQKDLGIIDSYLDAQKLVWEANPSDKTYLVPAFTGLGAPYWDSDATGIFCGITRVTKKAELVRAGVECIAYQIADVIHAMNSQQLVQRMQQELRLDCTRKMKFSNRSNEQIICLKKLRSGEVKNIMGGKQLSIWCFQENSEISQEITSVI